MAGLRVTAPQARLRARRCRTVAEPVRRRGDRPARPDPWRPGGEETEGTAQPLIVAGASRTKWLGSHLLFAALGPAVCLSVLGAATGLVYGTATGDLGVLPSMVGTTLAKLPALWVIAGLTIALFGLLPKAASAASWTVLGLVLLLELGWELG